MIDLEWVDRNGRSISAQYKGLGICKATGIVSFAGVIERSHPYPNGWITLPICQITKTGLVQNMGYNRTIPSEWMSVREDGHVTPFHDCAIRLSLGSLCFELSIWNARTNPKTRRQLSIGYYPATHTFRMVTTNHDANKMFNIFHLVKQIADKKRKWEF